MKQNLNTAHKRGQATLFIVLGIVLVGIIGIYLFLNDVNPLTSLGTSEEQTEQIEDLKECLSYYGNQGLKLIEAQGGYIIVPEEKVEIQNKEIGFINDLTLESIESELSSYVAENIQRNCLTGQDRYEIEELEELNVEVEIEDGEINFNAEWPMQFINKQDSGIKFNVNNFESDINTNFKSLFEGAKLFAENSGFVDYNELYVNGNELNITIFSEDQAANIIILSSNEEYLITAYSLESNIVQAPEKESFFERIINFVLG